MVKFNYRYELLEALPTNQSCIDYLKKLRWPNKVISPYDPISDILELSKENQYRCKNTNKDFNVLTGTIAYFIFIVILFHFAMEGSYRTLVYIYRFFLLTLILKNAIFLKTLIYL